MYKLTIGMVLALVAGVGCAVETADSGETGEDLGVAQSDLLLSGSPHFVLATLSNGFANCPTNEVMLGTDTANGTRLVCRPMVSFFAPSQGQGFDGDRPSPFNVARNASGISSCGNAVAIGWNPSTKAIRCRLTSNPTFTERPAANTTTNTHLGEPSHKTWPYFQFHNPSNAGAGNNDELPRCQGDSRAVTEMAVKSIAYYNTQTGQFQGNVLSGFFSCGS